VNLSFALLAISAAIGYTLAALFIKQALSRGASGHFVNLFANVATALGFQLMLLFDRQPFELIDAWQPILAGLLFISGNLLTFLALSRGAMGMVTPLLGAKTVFVVVIVSLLSWQALPGRWWFAAGLCTLGVFLVSGGGARLPIGSGGRLTILTALASAFCFAFTDALLQLWSPHFGIGGFVPIMFVTVGICSPLYSLIFERGRIELPPRAAWTPLLIGTFLLVAQVLIFCLSIVLSRDAAAANIFYSTRAVLGVLAVPLLGAWIGLSDVTAGPGVFVKRLIGAVLIFSAVLLALI